MVADPVFDGAADPDRLRRFIDALEADGFQRDGMTARWVGPTRASLIERGHTDAAQMSIAIRASWPYVAPLLHVPGVAAWHADQEFVCLWQDDDASQEWATLAGFHERIDKWASEAQGGFENTENARNPEIYWQEPAGRIAGLVDLDELVGSDRADGQQGQFVFTEAASADGRASPVTVLDISPGKFTSRTMLPGGATDPSVFRGRWFFRSEVPHPPRAYVELRDFMTPKQREWLDRDLRHAQHVMFGLVWPNAAGLVATMVLMSATGPGTWERTVVSLRPKGRQALLLRAGPDAAALQERTVAVIGVGAIGSFVADALARAGVGTMRLIDYDLLWPVNLVRHAAPPGTPAATPKTAALRENLEQYPWVRIEEPDTPDDGIAWSIPALRGLVSSADLTIDATGHGGLAELAARVALDAGRPFVSVALFRGGAVGRVRRQALPSDTPFIQRPHLDRYPEIPPLDEEAEYVGTETGCLALVHNAPPVVVTHVAALAAEVAIDHLTERHEQPDEIVEVFRVGDPPFDALGRIRTEDLPVTVDVTERVQALLRNAAAQAVPRETGGVLLGCTIDERTVVTDAVIVSDEQATATSFKVPANATAEIVAAAREHDSRIGYVGEWHSHTQAGGPSALDVATMIEIASDTPERAPVLMLVTVTPESTSLAGYVASRRGMRHVLIADIGELPAEST